MKKLFLVLVGISSTLTAIAGLIAVVLNSRLLFSGELMAYAHVANAYYSTIMKILVGLFFLLAVAAPWVVYKNPSKTNKIILAIIEIGLLVLTVVSVALAGIQYTENLIGIPVTILLVLCPLIHAVLCWMPLLFDDKQATR